MSRYNIDTILRAVAVPLHTVPDIAEHIGCSTATVNTYVQRAETSELITRTRAGKLDVIELTEAGKQRIGVA